MHKICEWYIYGIHKCIFLCYRACWGTKKHRELNRAATVRDTVVVFNEMWSHVARSFRNILLRFAIHFRNLAFHSLASYLYVFFFFDKMGAGLFFTSCTSLKDGIASMYICKRGGNIYCLFSSIRKAKKKISSINSILNKFRII